MYALLLAVIYFAFVSLGLPDSLVGAGWPVMHIDLGVPVSYAGILAMIVSAGTIFSSLMSHRLTQRLGAGLVTAVSVGLTALALLGFSGADQFWQLCLLAIPYGLGAGAVDAALNNYVALHYSSRHMNWLHSFWGVGASLSPFVMSHSLGGSMGWHGGYRIVGAIQVVLTILIFMSLPLWTKVNPPQTGVEDSNSPPERAGTITLKKAVAIPGVKPVLAAFCAFVGLEQTAILWSATFLVQERDVDPVTAAAFASLFLIGVTAGRFLSGLVADRLGDRQLIRLGSLLMGIGVVVVALPLPTNIPALAGLVLTGLGSAPIYPSLIHATPTNFGANNSQAIIGIQMAAAYTGTTLFPPVFGHLFSKFGLWLFPFIMVILLGLGFAMTELLNKTIDGRTGPLEVRL